MIQNALQPARQRRRRPRRRRRRRWLQLGRLGHHRMRHAGRRLVQGQLRVRVQLRWGRPSSCRGASAAAAELLQAALRELEGREPLFPVGGGGRRGVVGGGGSLAEEGVPAGGGGEGLWEVWLGLGVGWGGRQDVTSGVAQHNGHASIHRLNESAPWRRPPACLPSSAAPPLPPPGCCRCCLPVVWGLGLWSR